MNKICVYTCITGNYDRLPPIYNEEGIDYICYTNNKNVKSNEWQIRYIEDELLSNVQLARKIKILGTEELKLYDVTMWMDGIIDFHSSIKKFINEYVDLKKYDLVGFKHSSRKSINEEIVACYESDRISLDDARYIQNQYKKVNFPDNNGLIESGVLFRNFNNKKLKDCMKLWFSFILKLSHRDQLSFNYAQYVKKIKINLLDINMWDNNYFIANLHSKSFSISLYFKENGVYLFKNCIVFDNIYNLNDYISLKIPVDTSSVRLKITSNSSIIINNIKCNLSNDIKSINNKKWNDNFFVEFPAVFEIDGNFKKGNELRIDYVVELFNKYDAIHRLYNETIEEVKMIEVINKLKKENNELKQYNNKKKNFNLFRK